jgi:peptide/nickel transport system substrate-binding protein
MKAKTLILFVITALVFLACSKTNNNSPGQNAASAGTPAYGDVFVDSSIGDASNLITMLATDAASHEVAGNIYNGLVKYDKDFNIVPDLAESWEIKNDGKTIIFHLRKNVLWHDGKPFTARDVMFTYRLIIDPKTPTAYAEKYKEVKSARIVDDYTFEVNYDRPFAPGLISWGGLEMLPEHLLKGKDISSTPLSRSPVGTGPYRFKSWKTGDRIVLEAFDKYFDGRPYISGVVYRVITDQSTQFMELKAGNIDMMGLTPLQYIRQTDTKDFSSNYTKYKYLADLYTYLGFNQRRPPFSDIRVRQAIAYAIDKDEIIKGVLMGLGMEATGPYKPGTVWYNPKVKKYPYDPAKAKELLKEAGYADANGDGILERNGRPFEITIITNQGNSLREKATQIIQQRLGAVGIKVNIRIIEWTSFIKEFVDKYNFDAIILGFNILQDPDCYAVWHSSQAVPGSLNLASFKNAEVDRLIDEGRHTFDIKKRKACYDRIQEILANEQPFVFLYIPYSLPIVSSRVKGIEPAPAGISYNFTKWYVPKKLQKYQVIP